MSDPTDIPANFSASPAAELFGGIRPETPVLPSSEVSPVSPAPKPRKTRTQHEKDPIALPSSDDPDADAIEPDAGLTEVPVGQYRLRRGALALPLVESDDGTWQDTFMTKVLQSVGVEHRLDLRRPAPGFYLEGTWTVVEAIELALLVRVDDLTPVGKSEDK